MKGSRNLQEKDFSAQRKCQQFLIVAIMNSFACPALQMYMLFSVKKELCIHSQSPVSLRTKQFSGLSIGCGQFLFTHTKQNFDACRPPKEKN